jgi:hypothetical protein
MEILGVYRPFISKQVYREQWRGTGSDEHTDAHFRELILIEAVLHDATEPLEIGEVGQEYLHNDLHPYPNNFQVAYDELLLSLDGKTVLKRAMKCVRGEGPLRFAFYLYFYDPARPLSTPLGVLTCPPLEPVSPRLKRLVPYRACS